MEVSRAEGRKVPRAVYFVLATKFMQRYCVTGISTILVIYLNKSLELDENTSTAVFHINETFTYLFPLIGAIIAESYFGLFWTITVMCFITFVGSAIVAGISYADTNAGILIISLVSLAVVFASLGSIKANLSTFGADQYPPEDISNLRIYFSLQMICIKFGSLIGRTTTPIFREDFKCFGRDSCYMLAFGVPSLAMLLAFGIMISGRRSFVCLQPVGNVFVDICQSIIYALRRKFGAGSSEKKAHWMDHAEHKFGADHVDATKRVLRTFVIILPTAVYWAVFMQQGSRWIFQAIRMNGDLGFVTLKPDQMIAMNSVFAIILLPVCTHVIFPLLAKIGVKSLLYKIAIGGFLCCISFVMAAVVEIYIQRQVISMLWLFPQFAVLALSENFVYISLMDFAYSETPEGMKSVMTAFVFLMIALGNFIITLISGFNLFATQVYEFLFLAVILFIDMIIFIVLAKNYYSNKAMTTTRL